MTKNSLTEIMELLLANNSRSYTDSMVDLIEQKPELFEDFWTHYLSLQEPVSRKAAWIISHAALRMPHLIGEEHLRQILLSAPAMKHDAEKRNLAKILTLVSIPESLYGEVLDLCFNWLNDTGESIAVRVYCMETLQTISLEIPEIRGELISTIENHMDRFSAGLKSKGSKVVKKLMRL